MLVKKLSYAAMALFGTTFLIAPAANASGFIVVDPAFHVPPPAPIATTTTIAPGTTRLNPSDPRTPRPNRPVLHGNVSTGLSLDKQEITVDIENHVSKTYIKQTFRNDTDRNLAGTYLFPLPQDATFSSFSLHIDGKAVEGEILAAGEARAQYEQIVRSMIDPGLLEYADYKTVRVRVFPIPAHGTKTMELEYTQLVKADGGMFKYKFPLKTAHCDAIDETKINVKLKSKEELRTIWSPSHIISTDRKDDGHIAVVSFSDKDNSSSDKDFSVFYTVSDKDLSASLLTHKKSDQDGYFLMTLNPPFTAKEVISKDIVLVADTSGSMNGEKMEQSKKALTYVIDSLNPGDRFSLVQFNTDAEAFQTTLLEASAENKKKAKQFIDELEPRGGTNIGDALATGLEILNSKPDDTRPAYLVLMTDGQPTVGTTDTADLLKSVKPKRDIRLFDFGVGYDVNTKLLNKLAEDHHGTSQYVEPDENLETILSCFYSKMKSPVLSDVSISYEGVDVKDVYPKETKDIFAGSPVMLLGRYKGGAPSTVKLTGKVNGTSKSFSFPLAFAESETGSPYLPRMWAMRRIGYLTDVAQANENNQEVVDEIVELSKRYGIISAYTSFLVTDPNERSRPVRGTVMRPNPFLTGSRASSMPSRSLASAPPVVRFSSALPATSLDSFVVRNERRAARAASRDTSLSAVSSGPTSGHASAMPIAWGDEGSSGVPGFFSFSNKQKIAMAGGGGAGAEWSRSGLPQVAMGKFVSAKGVPVPGGSDMAFDMSAGDDEVADKVRVKEAKTAFAKALAQAKPAGEAAVQVQKELSNLKSPEALASAGGAGGIKVIGDKTFYLLNGFWVDSSFEGVKEPNPSEIEFGSKKYFELVKNEAGISQYLSAGQQVILVFNGRCYKIVAPAGNMG